jgi:hypothetical protein
MVTSPTLCPFARQRASHLQGDQSAEGIAGPEIRAAWLESKNGLQVKVGHLLDSFAGIIEPLNSDLGENFGI